MSNSTLGRIGSYEGRKTPETYREDCLDVRINGVAQAMDAATEAVQDPLWAEEEMVTLQKGAARLDAVKRQLRKASFEVSPLAEARVAELTAAYADAFTETMRAIDDRTPEGIAAAKRVTLLMRNCQALAERLIGPLGQAIASEARRKVMAAKAAKKPAPKDSDTGEIDLAPERTPQEGDTGDATQVVAAPAEDIDFTVGNPDEPLEAKDLDEWLNGGLDNETIAPVKAVPPVIKPAAKPAPAKK